VLILPAGSDDRGTGLTDLLGVERSAALTRLLLRRAVGWAVGVAAGRVFLGRRPGDAVTARDRALHGTSSLRLSGDSLADQLAGGVGSLLRAGAGPLLIAWPVLASWRPEHARGALDDLADGCALVVGPVFDGGFYLLAFDGPASWLTALGEQAWHSPEAIGLAIAAGHAAGGELGLLRAERALRGPGDVRAALADPLLDAELAVILRPG